MTDEHLLQAAVTTEDRKVSPTTLSDKNTAEDVAWAAPGATKVCNHTTVE